MFRFLLTSIFVVLLGLGSGYFMWGARVGNLTQSLNMMVLEQEALMARLAKQPKGGSGSAPASAGSDGAGSANLAAGDAGDLTTIVAALKEEIAYQGKRIEAQTELLNKLGEEMGTQESAALDNCQVSMQQLNTQLQRCLVEKQEMEPPVYAPGAYPAPSARPSVPGTAPSALGQPGVNPGAAYPGGVNSGAVNPGAGQPRMINPSAPQPTPSPVPAARPFARPAVPDPSTEDPRY